MNVEALAAELRNYAGKKVDLSLAIERDLRWEEVVYLGDDLIDKGGDIHLVEMKNTPWPHTLRVVFTQPEEGVGFFWIPAIAIVGTLGGLGIFGYTAYKAGTFMDKLAENLIPIVLILGGTAVLTAYALRR